MSGGKANVGDTVRIHDNAKVHPALQGRLAEVTEVKSWGVQAAIYADAGVAFVRVSHGEYSLEGNREGED